MASDTSQDITATACEQLRRVNEEKLFQYCGSREDRIRSTAISTGVIAEGDEFDPDWDEVFESPVESPADARLLALGLVWEENPHTDEPLIESHDGFYDALFEANQIANGLFSPADPVPEPEETDEEGADADASEDEEVDPLDEPDGVDDESEASESESDSDADPETDLSDLDHLFDEEDDEAEKLVEEPDEEAEADESDEADDEEAAEAEVDEE